MKEKTGEGEGRVGPEEVKCCKEGEVGTC